MKHLQKLLNEARGLKGMIAEVACKSRLLASQIKQDKIEEDSAFEEMLVQMQSDLDKYSERLREIIQELNNVSNLDRMEDPPR